MSRVCVYAGSAPGRRPAYLAAARALGAEVARRGLGLVYGGSSVGLMTAVADAALAGGAEVIGVLPRGLEQKEIAHRGLTELRIVDSLHERKAQMTELSDAFVALPGGLGTLDELFETTTWVQLEVHRKPYGLLDAEGYWRPLLAALDHMTAEGFISPQARARIVCHEDPTSLLDTLLPRKATS